VIVVDSTGDGTAERIARRFPECRVEALPERVPQAAARNIGVAAARGTFVALTDHDCLVPPDWLARLLARHATAEYAAVAGPVVNGTPESAVGTAAFWIEFNEFTPKRPAGLVIDAPHCNICLRRTALERSEPFPLVPPAAEDLIFNHRLVEGGGRIYFDPAIVVTHVNRTRFRDYVHHQRVLGFGSAVARRLAPLRGRMFIQHPLLAPLLPLVRLGRTLTRIAQRHPERLAATLALLPLMVPGYVSWTSGFLQGRRVALNPPPRADTPRASLQQCGPT
jgi:glycosyltransferase involved in cell wall biosynthesis